MPLGPYSRNDLTTLTQTIEENWLGGKTPGDPVASPDAAAATDSSPQNEWQPNRAHSDQGRAR